MHIASRIVFVFTYDGYAGDDIVNLGLVGGGILIFGYVDRCVFRYS